ncbi:MAG: hypothetical protein M1816_003927 [Peltula sp. TS41687]|nr:MAG: hypothetical protein M1816_003927 [Peltula sp. TS41687]
MTVKDVTYRIRVRCSRSDDEDGLVSMSDISYYSEELRKQWIERLTDNIWRSRSSSSVQAIRSWDFILALDGSVESLPVSKAERESSGMYPAHYRIPPANIDHLEQQEKIIRQERFAFATLLYEVGSGKKPFEWLSNDEVQRRYSNAEFPDDVKTLPPPLFIVILSCWSVEFANISTLYPFIDLKQFLTAAVNPPRSSFSRVTAAAGSYIRAHPYLFALQATGILVSTASMVALPVLGAVGFSAVGPVAGSVAAGWQASLGVVEAGSLFAWCQSVAMGGVAVNAIVAAGAAGGGVAALATAATAATAGTAEQRATVDVNELFGKFKEVYIRGEV